MTRTKAALGFVSALGLVLLLAPPASAAEDDVSMTATIGGRDVSEVGVADPIDLDPEGSVDVVVEVTNDGDDAVAVRDVAIDGVVIGITFLAYDTDVNLDVPAGSTEDIAFALPLRGLADQAVGLVPASMTLHDQNGDTLASEDFMVDVAGSSSSLFAQFGIFLAVITAGTLLLNLWLVWRRRLPPNRLGRALRFAVSGIGIGLTMTVALAATRVLPPYPSAWIPMLVVPTVAAFILGFLSPGPLADAWPEDEIDRALETRRERETATSTPAGARDTVASTGERRSD